MIKKTISYRDYNGVDRTEDFYFNLTEAELAEMQLGIDGGLSALIQKVIMTKDFPTLVKLFKDLILKAYGEKSLDGRRFVKNQEVRDNFSQTEAYSKLFMECATSAEAAAEFINGLVEPLNSSTSTDSAILSINA